MLSQLRGFFGRKAPTESPLTLEPLPVPVIDDVEPVIDNSEVAFTVPSMDGAPPVQILFPTILRQHRIEPDVVVHSLIYRDFEKAVQVMVLHGKARTEFGGCKRVPLMTADTHGLRDDEVLANAVAHAEDVLWAMRHPVTVPEVVEPSSEVPVDGSTTEPPAKVALGGHLADPAVAASPRDALQHSAGDPVLTIEGEFLSSGMLPYKNPNTKQIGKPSFAVVVKVGGLTTTYHGSDLQRALRHAGVLPGDRVRLDKYAMQKVRVGARTVSMNIWDCTVVDRA